MMRPRTQIQDAPLQLKGGAGRSSSPLDEIRPERWTVEMSQELMELPLVGAENRTFKRIYANPVSRGVCRGRTRVLTMKESSQPDSRLSENSRRHWSWILTGG